MVFDWDGTVLDSIGVIVACAQRTLRELGLREVEPQAIRDTIGLSMREVVEVFAPGCDEEMFDRVVTLYRGHWMETFWTHASVFDGAREALAELSRRGYLLAVATGKSRAGLARDLERSALGELFALTRTVDEARAKPDPQMLHDIMRMLDVSSESTLMIGDTTHDLDMARNAGVRSVGVCSGSHSRQTLESAKPVACLPSIAALPSWIDEGA